jgi:hypothetical protein
MLISGRVCIVLLQEVSLPVVGLQLAEKVVG